MNIEGIAVHAVEGLLLKSDHLKPYIQKDDRTPLTDGHIDVYTDSTQANDDLSGRVAVQVKGRAVGKGSKHSSVESFNIKRSTLQGFLHTKGVLFFLVLIDKNSARGHRIHHTVLTPFKILHLLDSMPDGQLSKTIHLKKFPSSTKKMESILQLAIRAQDETPSLGFDTSLFNNAREFELYTDSQVSFERPISLNYKDIGFTVRLLTPNGMSIPIPGQMIIYPPEYVEHTLDVVIESGDIVFLNPVARRLSETHYELTLSDGLKIELPYQDKSRSGRFQLTHQNSVAGSHRDIEFLLTCLDKGSFRAGKYEFRFKAAPTQNSSLHEEFKELDRLIQLFDALHVDATLIKLSDITESAYSELNTLYQSIVEKKEITEELDNSARIQISIGPWFLELMRIRNEISGKHQYISTFSEDLPQQFYKKESESQGDPRFSRITPYDAIEDTGLAYTLNLELGRITDEYAQVFEYPETSTRANHTVLRLIDAADSMTLRREEFLGAAEQLNEWLIEKEDEYPSHLINRWQILFRRRALQEEHKRQIRTLRRNSSDADPQQKIQIEFCCSVLLGDEEEANDRYDALDTNAQDILQRWPIWKLRTSRSEILTSPPVHHNKDGMSWHFMLSNEREQQ